MPNAGNLISNAQRTPEQRREIARKAGLESGRARRERRSVADALRMILDEAAPSGGTRLDALARKAVFEAFKRGRLADLKTMAEILGELKQARPIADAPLVIVVGSERERADVLDIIDRPQ